MAHNNRTILELVAADRPGLLSEVGKVFKAERRAIDGAKIMTIGERAEDVFYLTNEEGRSLTKRPARNSRGGSSTRSIDAAEISSRPS